MLDFTKPITTRDGRKVRVLCTDARSDLPVVALVTSKGGCEFLHCYQPDGRAYRNGQDCIDLINVPQKRTVWLNWYGENRDMAAHASKEDADHCAGIGRLACIPIEIEVPA